MRRFLTWSMIGLAAAAFVVPSSKAADQDAALQDNSQSVPPSAGQPAQKPRLLVLTDIGGDPDDQQSMVRLMTYANEFDIEGLIASAAGTPGELKEKITRPELIREIVAAYGKVRENLVRHAPGYPTTERLLNVIKSGNHNRGLSAIGAEHDTEGSQWIIAVTDKPDPRPVNVSIWGGQTDLAQALWRVRHDRGPEGLRTFISKLRIHDIADQDGIAEWIWDEFPGLFYILNMAPKGRDRREAAFRGLYLGGDESLVSREWMETHIRRNHGPLGALYPPRTWTAPNPHSAIKEGDTPSWFYFLPHGVNDSEHPDWGGWGGRFERVRERIFRDAKDTVGEVTDARATVWRWRPAFQAEFQARMDWCIAETFEGANHKPVAVLNGDSSRRVVELSARSGEIVKLSAEGSHDPDKNTLTARWFLYPEAGTFRGNITLASHEGWSIELPVPEVTTPQTIHIILEVQDDGSPRLSAFRRAILVARP